MKISIICLTLFAVASLSSATLRHNHVGSCESAHGGKAGLDLEVSGRRRVRGEGGIKLGLGGKRRGNGEVGIGLNLGFGNRGSSSSGSGVNIGLDGRGKGGAGVGIGIGGGRLGSGGAGMNIGLGGRSQGASQGGVSFGANGSGRGGLTGPQGGINLGMGQRGNGISESRGNTGLNIGLSGGSQGGSQGGIGLGISGNGRGNADNSGAGVSVGLNGGRGSAAFGTRSESDSTNAGRLNAYQNNLDASRSSGVGFNDNSQALRGYDNSGSSFANEANLSASNRQYRPDGFFSDSALSSSDRSMGSQFRNTGIDVNAAQRAGFGFDNEQLKTSQAGLNSDFINQNRNAAQAFGMTA